MSLVVSDNTVKVCIFSELLPHGITQVNTLDTDERVPP